MALLTADDVLNKKFQSVKFREGYDQVEVDEFLDEVVATIYALQVEKAELADKLQAAERRISEFSGGVPMPVAEPVVPVEPTPEPEFVPEPAPVVVPGPAATSEPESATSMLALAQRLHDEYVNDGREEGERIVSEARHEGQEIIVAANRNRDEILQKLDSERGMLENKINELRSFEADYRSSLTNHLEGLLENVRAES